MNTATTDRDTALALCQGWADFWNGDLSQAEQILAPGLTVNAAIVGVDGASVQGRQGVAGWLALLRKALSEPVFTIEVGPIIDGDLVCGRWHLQGEYAGGMLPFHSGRSPLVSPGVLAPHTLLEGAVAAPSFRR